MIKVSIHYPNSPGCQFNHDYYMTKHMPMAIEKLSPLLKGASIDVGNNGGLPNVPAPYVVVCNLLFDRLEDFYTAFMPHMALMQSDMANYTNVIPAVQISDVTSFL